MTLTRTLARLRVPLGFLFGAFALWLARADARDARRRRRRRASSARPSASGRRATSRRAAR